MNTPTPMPGTALQAMERARTVLADHPPYAADTTFAAIWQWLEAKQAALDELDAAIASAQP